MAASAAAIAAKSRRPPFSVLPSTALKSSSIPVAGTGGSQLYASASSVGCSVAGKPAGSPLRKAWCERSLPLLPRGKGGGQSPPDEGAAPRNPHPQPLTRWRGESRLRPRVFLAYVSGPSGGRSGAPSLLPRGEGGGRSPTNEGVAATNPHADPSSVGEGKRADE